MRYEISKYDVNADEQDVLELWSKVFPGVCSARFSWIYRNNPAGQAQCFIARLEGQQALAGMTALFPRQIKINGNVYKGGIAGDFAVDKKHRGFGPALGLQSAAISSCRDGHYDCVYGIPLEHAKGVMNRAGYISVGRGVRMTKLLSTRSFLRKRFKAVLSDIASPFADFVLKVGSRETYCRNDESFVLAKVKDFDSRYDALWEKVGKRQGILAERSSAYLSWRFLRCPHTSYEVFELVDVRNNELVAYVVGETKDNSFRIVDMIAADENSTVDILIAKLLRELRHRNLESVTTTYYGRLSFIRKLRRFGFSVRDQTLWLVAYAPPNTPLASNIANLENWHLFPGDNDI